VVVAIAFAVAFAASFAERFERNLLHDTGVPPGLEHDLRLKIWAVAGERFLEAPWLGHGFGREVLASSFEPLTPPRVNHPMLRHGHDMFIDLALETGVVGLVAFAALLAALARRYRAMLRDPALAHLGMLGLALLWALNAMLLGLARSRPPAGEAATA
jgi:O-antigen ligase